MKDISYIFCTSDITKNFFEVLKTETFKIINQKVTLVELQVDFINKTTELQHRFPQQW